MRLILLPLHLMAFVLTQVHLAAAVIHVSPQGKDANPGTVESPLATPHAARDKDHAIIDPALVKESWGRARDAQINIVPQWRFFNQWNTVTKVDAKTGRIDIADSERHAKIIAGNWFWIEGVSVVNNSLFEINPPATPISAFRSQPSSFPPPLMHLNPNNIILPVLSAVLLAAHLPAAEPKPFVADLKPDILRYDPFTWPGKIPEGCPFERSKAFNAVRFLGVKSGFRYGDTWYPAWAENDILYSPWTDGKTKRLDGYTDWSQSWVHPVHITTGQGVILGDDPLNLIAYSIGLDKSSPAAPYPGRYPCGSLIHNGVWYYGTYCLGPEDGVHYGKSRLNWPWIGPFVGFRHSTDYGHIWTPPPHTPEKPLFGESGMWGYPVRIGAPKFVDFGKNMQHSPDGKAYLVAHGADQETSTNNWRMWNNSWITGDQIYLLRVTPGIKTINDPAAYEFYGGKDKDGKPVWTNDFAKIKPLLEWDNNMGCVTVTYNPVLKKYIMCVTDGGNTVSRMNTYLLESNRLDGDWKIIAYMKDFGTQAYFVNIPSKFIGADGVTMWLLYSGNFSLDQNQKPHPVNPPGGHYGMTFQKIQLLREASSGTARGSE